MLAENMCRFYFKFIVTCVILSVVYADLCFTPDSDIGECIPFRFCTELVTILENKTTKSNAFLRKFFCEGGNGTNLMVCCSVTKDKFAYVFDEIRMQPQENVFVPTSLKNLDGCGIQSKQASNSTGGPASLDEFPWLVYVVTVNHTGRSSPEYFIACAGTLINSRYVLTSAQCIVKAGGASGKFLVSVEKPLTKNRTSAEEPDSDESYSEFHFYDLENLRIHPSFNEMYILYDIALLKLNESIVFEDHIRPVCLPLSEFKIAKPRDQLTTAGFATWGSRVKVTTMLISNTGCKVIHERRNVSKFITKHEMCGIKFQNGGCRDESPGNPVLFSANGRWYVNGISSWSVNCSNQFPKVYTKVSSYLKWIEANTRDAHQDNESSNREDVNVPITLRNPENCGYQHVEQNNSADGPIAPNEFPWMAYILSKRDDVVSESNYLIACTGSLITSRYVLSNAQCFHPNIAPSIDFVVAVEEYHVQNTTTCTEFSPFYDRNCSTWSYYELNDIVIHPSYNRWTYENDIALLRLNGFVSFTDYIRPLCLPLPGFKRPEPGNTLATSSYVDWGVKTKASIKVIANEDCRPRLKQMNYTETIHKYEMCAVKSKNAVKITCDQVVSGPVMYSNNNRWYLEAIHSRGGDCSNKVLTIYTKVADYLPWIQANTKDDRCNTPNGNMGECTPLRSCPQLLESFTNPKKEEEAYLRKYICENGTKSDFMVCCSRAKNFSIFQNEEEEAKRQKNTIIELTNLENCGLQRKLNYDTKDGAIPADEFPWLATVISHEREIDLTHYPDYRIRCTGAVINSRYVLAAANCLTDGVTPLTFFHVSIAEYSDANCTELTPFYILNCTKLRHFGIEEKIIHPFYNRWTRMNNIALLRLNRIVPFTGYTRPVCLHLPGIEAADSRELLYTAGHTSWTNKTKSSLELISNSECTNLFKQRSKVLSITQYEMCTIKSNSGTKATCDGVIASPIMSYNNKRWYLEGIHPAIRSCSNEVPVVSTRIPNYFQWLQEHIRPDTCTTPHGEPGICKYLKDCPRLVTAFANPEKYDDEVQDPYLRSFECPRTTKQGRHVGDVIIVCCSISPNFTVRSVPDYKALEDKNAVEFDNFKYCGLQHTDDYFSVSDDIAIDEFPWSAAIYLRDLNYTKQGPRIICTGTLISRRYVLTAASCMAKIFDWDRVGVRLGEYNVNNATDCVDFPQFGANDCTTAEEYQLDRRKYHEFYDIFSALNDIALLRLKKQVHFTDYIRPICLPSPKVLYVKPGDRLYTTGWGRNIIPGKLIGDEAELKKKIRTVLITNEECLKKRQAIYDTTAGVSVNQFCTDFRNETDFLCDVDAGGPLMTKYKNKWYVIGISSRNACKEKVPQIHTNVTMYLGWIRRYIDFD